MFCQVKKVQLHYICSKCIYMDLCKWSNDEQHPHNDTTEDAKYLVTICSAVHLLSQDHKTPLWQRITLKTLHIINKPHIKAGGTDRSILSGIQTLTKVILPKALLIKTRSRFRSTPKVTEFGKNCELC
uniref:Uncharacterized protein n=1 Tax=Poecilia reticulata TaxID=8081 RepID=A0A3P9P977_POERE